MNTLEQYLSTNSSQNQAEGESFAIQWMPDIYTRETLNIGICFKNSESGELESRVLDYFERIQCLYGKNAEFNLKLACEVAADLIKKNSLQDSVQLTQQIRCVKTGYAQGGSTNEILERLYSDLVPLGRKPSKPQAKRYSPTTRDTLYKRLIPSLKESLELDFSKHVPTDPYQKVALPIGEKKVYLPFKRDGGVATLISTAYSDALRAKCNLFDGYQDVDIASSQLPGENNAVFILMPASDAQLEKAVTNAIENQVDEFVWQMKKHQIEVQPHTEQNELANQISDWCLAG